jgi:hypothetical protein
MHIVWLQSNTRAIFFFVYFFFVLIFITATRR